jgi:hypothetical protein
MSTPIARSGIEELRERIQRLEGAPDRRRLVLPFGLKAIGRHPAMGIYCQETVACARQCSPPNGNGCWPEITPAAAPHAAFLLLRRWNAFRAYLAKCQRPHLLRPTNATMPD